MARYDVNWNELQERVVRLGAYANGAVVQLEAARQERDAVLADLAAFRQERDAAQAALAAVTAERDAAVEALRAVEWTRGFTGYCPWCNKSERQGHAPDCKRQAVLEAHE